MTQAVCSGTSEGLGQARLVANETANRIGKSDFRFGLE